MTMPSPVRRRGPGLQVPFFMALLGLFVAIVLALASAFMAGPDFLELYKVLGSSGLSDARSITASIQSILSPEMSILFMATTLAVIVFSIALLWLFVSLVIRLCRR